VLCVHVVTLTLTRCALAHVRYFTIEKAKRDLGYKPKVSLKEGMARTLKAFEHMRNPKAAVGGSSGSDQKKKAK
jgi:nucleoside-diphosphate-sugar epimerase